MKYKSLGCLAVVVGLFVVVLFAGSAYMVSYALMPNNNPGLDYPGKYKQLFREYPETRPWVDSLRRVGALRDTFVTMATGERHHAFLIPAPRKTGRTAVIVHGYTDCAVSMLSLGYMYHHGMGYNLLLPDLHGHGKSEGRAAQMGWKDRWDVKRWVTIADSLWRDSTDKAEIVVHGVSMGAATIMALSGEEVPSSVKCFVEDCGYTSVWDELGAQLKEQFGLPEFPLMYTASMLCKLKYGWSFGEASMLRQVEKCHKPMLFIHGDKDTYVPTRMVYPLYKAKTAPKAIYIAPGSIHAHSYLDHRKEYAVKVKEFVSQYE